jgi:hypothetical protein
VAQLIDAVATRQQVFGAASVDTPAASELIRTVPAADHGDRATLVHTRATAELIRAVARIE